MDYNLLDRVIKLEIKSEKLEGQLEQHRSAISILGMVSFGLAVCCMILAYS